MLDSSCGIDSVFSPVEVKSIDSAGAYEEILSMPAYSAQMIVLKKEDKDTAVVSEPVENKTE